MPKPSPTRFPVAAIVGRADLIDRFATGGVLHGGTFNAQPVAMAALVATQRALTPEHYERTGAEGLRLQEGIRAIFKDAWLNAIVSGFPLIFYVPLGLATPPRNWRDVARRDHATYLRFAHGLLKRGVRALERGAWFVSSEHTGTVIDDTLEAVRGAAREIA